MANEINRVLVVDDEASIRELMAWCLREEGYQVALAASGRDALERLTTNERFDVVLLDLVMRDMTGMALYEHLERTKPEIIRRIIFVTAGPSTPAAYAFLRRINNQQLVKPFTLDMLLQVVSSQLKVSEHVTSRSAPPSCEASQMSA